MRAAARVYHNDPQVSPYDGGRVCLPKGRQIGTTINSVRPVASIIGASGVAFQVTLSQPFFLSTVKVGSKIGIQGTENFDSYEWTVSQVTDQTTFSVMWGAAPGATETSVGHAYIINSTLEGGLFVDAARVLSHPSFPQREGEGIYTYPVNPGLTRNFIYAPAPKVDGVVQKTVGGNILVQQPQVAEDPIISEVWFGSDRSASTLTEMARVFDEYWKTVPDPGEALGWEPLDINTDRYNVVIVQVQIGGVDYNYQEARSVLSEMGTGFLTTQLTLSMKLASPVVAPRNSIVLEGV